MIYSEILKDEKIVAALEKAGLSHVQSPALHNGDWSMNITEESFGEFRNRIIDEEIIARRKHLDFEAKMKEAEDRMKPFRDQEARAAAAKPYVEKLVKGKLKEHFTSLEDAFVNVISEHVAERHDFRSIQPMEQDEQGMTELDRILKKARVTFLDRRVTPDDIVLSYLLNSSFIKMLK